MKLRDYQINISNSAYRALRIHKLAYLAMEVRTGKTLTALYTAELNGAKNVLFVTKKKAIKSIETDYSSLKPNYKLTCINFESLHKVGRAFDLVIIDEAHSLGAFPKPSQRAKKLKDKCKKLPIIFLSGTPTPESYSQMFHQLWISSYSPWNHYSNFYRWSRDYVKVKQKSINGFSINDYSDADEAKIKACIDPFLFTWTQTQAGFKQEIKEEILCVPMKEETKFALKEIMKIKITSVNGKTVLGDTPSKLSTKMHQLSSGTVIDEDGKYHILDQSKADFIRARFKGVKIAIFYVFKSEFEMLKKVFPNWTSSPEDFQQSDKVFLGQFRSVREGVRLDTADVLIFFNIEYSYLSYEQAKNRLQSMNREKEVKLYFLVSNCGIEKYIMRAVKNKENFTLSYYGKERKAA